jgi:hypothetical protein
VTSITVDGDEVYAAPPFDISMFDSPVHHFDARAMQAADGTVGLNFPETISGLADATPIGSPTYHADVNGFPAFEYDGNTDYHEWQIGPETPVGSEYFTIAALFKPAGDGGDVWSFGNTNTGEANILSVASNAFATIFEHDFYNDKFLILPTIMASWGVGDWATVAIRWGIEQGGDPPTRQFFLNGSPLAVDTASPNVTDGFTPKIGTGPNNGTFNGYIAEIVVSDVSEDNATVAAYHSNRAQLGNV